MLSRIAESLYWVGRYVERADDTARILDVHVHHMLEDPGIEEEAACRPLLAAMGPAIPPGELDTAAVTHALAFDRSNVSSIVGSLAAARENARGSREVLSSEMWECLNATYHTLGVQVSTAIQQGPHAFFSWVKERAAIMTGLAESTMPRDDAWRFLVLGRSLERTDMTARLLWTCFGDSGGEPNWVTTLRSCSAQQAFLRAYRRPPDAHLVAEFLLLDRLFPRSALLSLLMAERSLAELDHRSGRAGTDDEARRILGRVRNSLEYARASELVSDLPSHLRCIQAACTEASEAITRRFFHRRPPITWNRESSVQHT